MLGNCKNCIEKYNVVIPFQKWKILVDLIVPEDKNLGIYRYKRYHKFAQYSFIARLDAMGRNIEWEFEDKHHGLIIRKSWVLGTEDLLSGNKNALLGQQKFGYFLRTPN